MDGWTSVYALTCQYEIRRNIRVQRLSRAQMEWTATTADIDLQEFLGLRMDDIKT